VPTMNALVAFCARKAPGEEQREQRHGNDGGEGDDGE
jgi:hypothetical protein